MVTRSKVGIFKPKVLVIEIPEHELRTIDEAFAHEELKAKAQDEYDALIQNRTWELVSLLPRRKTIGCKWLFKVDVNNAFLNGDLTKKVYKQQPLSAVVVATNLVLHSKFKHVELDLFFVHEKVVAGSLLIGKVSACDQVVDILTKPLLASLFYHFQYLFFVNEVKEGQ
ncbi:hypothetical protein PVK06_027885 [Gossypium arboreum]|uniref:Retrovirus-related Pol polyprotein from transposon TNT 1-94 n=1 Tax=Gossypium arboreum TaxID=29729 RepID=A0ABR0P2S4_GOSAR|nr:hypothetical protein PVK06_027885 [Gossypium arboreum]